MSLILDPLYDRQIRALTPQMNALLQTQKVVIIGNNYLAQELTKQFILLGVEQIQTDAAISYDLTSRTKISPLPNECSICIVCEPQQYKEQYETQNVLYLYTQEDQLIISRSPQPAATVTSFIIENIAACSFMYFYKDFILGRDRFTSLALRY